MNTSQKVFKNIVLRTRKRQSYYLCHTGHKERTDKEERVGMLNPHVHYPHVQLPTLK